MSEQVLMTIDVKRLKKKFEQLLEALEENKAQAIGRFLEEEVKPHMSLEEFAELVKDIEGYAVRTLYKYQKIYKHNLPSTAELGIEKSVVIASIKDADAKEFFLERAENLTQKELQAEVSEYKETGVLPEEDSIGTNVQTSLRYNGAVLKLINEMRSLRVALNQCRQEKIFDSFSRVQKKKFRDYLGTIKQEYTDLIHEIDSSNEYLEDDQ